MIGLGLYGQAERSAGGGVISVGDRGQTATETGPSGNSDGIGGGTSDANGSGPESGDAPGDGPTDRWIVVARFSIIFGIPLATLVFALSARTRRAAIAARGIATLVLAGLTVLTVFSAGPGFVLATLLMGAATALAVTEPSGGPV